MSDGQHQPKPTPTAEPEPRKATPAPRPKPVGQLAPPRTTRRATKPATSVGAACRASAPVFALDVPRALLGGDGDAIELSLVNTSDEPQTIERFDVSSPAFVVELQRGISIAAGGALGIRVVFRPTSALPLHVATLQIAPMGDAPAVTATLQGIGIREPSVAPTPAAPPAPAIGDWGGVYGPEPRPRSVSAPSSAQPVPANSGPRQPSSPGPRRLRVIDAGEIRLVSVAGQPAMAARVDVLNDGADVAVLKAFATSPEFHVTGSDQFVAPDQRDLPPVAVFVHYVPRAPGEHGGELVVVDDERGHEIRIRLQGCALDPAAREKDRAAPRGIYGARAGRSGLALHARTAPGVAQLGALPAQIQRDLATWDAQAAQYAAQIRQGAAQLHGLLIAWVRDEGLTAVREHQAGGRQSAGSDMVQFVALKAAEAGLASGGNPVAALALVAADLAWSLYDAYSSNADNAAQGRAGASRIAHAAGFAARGAGDATEMFMQIHEGAVSAYKVARQELVTFARTEVQGSLMAAAVRGPATQALARSGDVVAAYDARRVLAERALRVLGARARATPQVVHTAYARLLDDYTAFRATGSLESAVHERHARGSGWINFDAPISVGYQLQYGRFANPSPTLAMHLGARRPRHVRGWNVEIDLRSVQGGSIQLRQAPDGRRSQTVAGEAIEAVERAGGSDRIWEVVDRRDRRLS